MKHLPATFFAVLLTTVQAAANPDEAPDIRTLVEAEIGDGFRVIELTVTAEELRRDGPDASYYGEFAASVILPVTLYHEIGQGEGYRLVGKLLERGETVPAFGSATAVYEDGRWDVQVNVLDLQLPGGHPFSEFRSPGIVVLEAGTDLVDRFLAQREQAFRDAEALRVQDARNEETETSALLARALADVAARDASLADARAALEQSEMTEAETAALLARALADVAARDASLADARAALEQSEMTEAETAALLARALADIAARDVSLAEAYAALEQSEMTEAETSALLARALADVAARDASLADALAALERSEAAGAETAASLAAARAELGTARSGAEADAAVIRELLAQADSARAEIDAKEAARLAEAAIAEALRQRLSNSEAELTALSLRLEAERKRAEETLALLAAANAAEEELNARLAEVVAKLDLAEGLLGEAEAAGAETAAELDAALAELALLAAARDGLRDEVSALRDAELDAERLREELAAALAARLAAENASASALGERDRERVLLEAAGRRLAEEREISSKAQREVALLNAQVAALRGQLAELSGLLDSADERDRRSKVRIDALGSRLNRALAQVAAEQRRAAAEARRRAELEAAEAERLRLEKEALGEEVVDLAAYRSEFFGTLRRVLGDREGVRIVGDRFLFPSEVLFESGSATLLPEGRASIEEVAGILVEVADEIPANLDWVLRVDGHTDSAPVVGAGEFADNWELSAGRALSVVKFMTGTLGFPPERLAAAGFGEYRPVNPEDTEAARAQNRRIELKLTER